MCVCPTCLCAGHEVSLSLDNWNGIFLDRGRSGVATQSDVTHDDLTHVHILELHSTHTVKDIYKKSSGELICNVILLDVELTRAAYTLDVVRAVLSCGFNRNVIVFLKVDPSVTAREQLTTEEQSRRKRMTFNKDLQYMQLLKNMSLNAFFFATIVLS